MNALAFGVFGGSFDPPHIAHTLFASYALSAYALERVLVVPTYTHAFSKRLTTFDDRLHMCELAFGELRRVEICDIERELPAPSLTLNTLRALSQRHRGVQLRLLIGSDIPPETHAWHDYQSIEREFSPIIIERQGGARHVLDQPALPAVSSSDIRRRIRADESTAGWLAPSVAD
ncbi:MAG: hypothetical protein RL701_5209, partial [Pseudomonadota bacterium]